MKISFERIRRAPSPAMVVAFIALFVALSGGAYAAKRIGTKSLRNSAVTSKKIKNRAVTSGKIRNGAVTNGKIGNGAVSASKLRNSAVGTAKLADGGVSTAKIADGAISASKLSASERGEGFVSNRSTQISLTATTDNVVATLNLPAGGSYVVTAATGLGGSAGGANYISCDLRDDGGIVTTGYGVVNAAVFEDTITLTGASDGGAVTVTCNPSSAAFARFRTITAIRAGSVQAQ